MKQWLHIHYNNVHIVTQPVTVEEAVGLGSVRGLVANGNPEDCELADAWLAVDVVAITYSQYIIWNVYIVALPVTMMNPVTCVLQNGCVLPH